MAAEIHFTDLTGCVLVIEKTYNGNLGLTIAKDTQALIDSEYQFIELEASEINELISHLQQIKKDIDINYRVPFKPENNG
jgi:hypothetical protein